MSRMATVVWHNEGDQYRRDHNVRNPKTVAHEKHINPDGYNETLIDTPDLRKWYADRFRNALEAYNAGRRRDRQITDYYQKVKNNKQKHLVYELITSICGKAEEIPPTEQIAILKQYAADFQKRNPKLELLGCYIHGDEEGEIHMHLDYIPVATYERGLKEQVAMDRAIQQQGFKPCWVNGKKQTPQAQWSKAERECLENLCKNRAIEVIHTDEHRGHLSTEIYKIKKDLEKAQQDLDKILSETDQMKEEIGKQSRELLDTAEQIKQLLDSGKRGLLDKDKITVSGKEMDECLERIKDFTKTSSGQIEEAKERLAKEREQIREEEGQKARKQIAAYQERLEILNRNKEWTEKQLRDLAKRYPKQVAEYAREIGDKSLLSMVSHQPSRNREDIER